MLVSSLSYHRTLKIEAIYSSETSIDFQQTTWRHIQEDRTLHNHRCDNLKSLDLVIIRCFLSRRQGLSFVRVFIFVKYVHIHKIYIILSIYGRHIYSFIYFLYIQCLCLPSLRASDVALSYVAQVTTTAQSPELP
jgi:hypothetical protein